MRGFDDIKAPDGSIYLTKWCHRIDDPVALSDLSGASFSPGMSAQIFEIAQH
ncbi:MAG: hypothetical protein AseanaTS_24470 [Candidatus Pelagadaptatus aseana]